MHEKKRIALIVLGCLVFVGLCTFGWQVFSSARTGKVLRFTEETGSGSEVTGSDESMDGLSPGASDGSGSGETSSEERLNSGKDEAAQASDGDSGQTGTLFSDDDNPGTDSGTPDTLEEAGTAGTRDTSSGNSFSGRNADNLNASENEGKSETIYVGNGEGGGSGSGEKDSGSGISSGGNTSRNPEERDFTEDKDGSHAEEALPEVSDPNLGGENELAAETKGSPALYAAQDSFSPVEKNSSPGNPAEGLLTYMRVLDSSYSRSEPYEESSSRETGSEASEAEVFSLGLIGYEAGDVYEAKPLYGETGTVAALYYYFPTGTLSRRGDLTYNEEEELPRIRAALSYLFPEEKEAVLADFATMRHWQETYSKATGVTEIPWSGYIRSRYYGSRYCRMALSYNSLIIKVYPAGYTDDEGDFADKGTYREFYNYPLR